MTARTRLFHGGFPGLRVGELLVPGHARRVHEGCEFCAARAAGHTVGGIDPPSARAAVYVTSDKEYARHYASLWGRGDLYQVAPRGELTLSEEDHFPSWTVAAAEVVAVYQRAVLLTDSQRRSLWRRWTVADAERLEALAAATKGGG